jgi:hypothetical protein
MENRDVRRQQATSIRPLAADAAIARPFTERPPRQLW